MKLSRLYMTHGIKRKKIRTNKDTHNMTLTRHFEQLAVVQEKMRSAIKDSVPVIYVDETMFTKRAMMTEEYSARY